MKVIKEVSGSETYRDHSEQGTPPPRFKQKFSSSCLATVADPTGQLPQACLDFLAFLRVTRYKLYSAFAGILAQGNSEVTHICNVIEDLREALSENGRK